MTADDHRYRVAVERWIVDVLANSPSDFANLVRQMPGVDPVLIHDILSTNPVFRTDTVNALLRDACEDRPLRKVEYMLPTPHPLDFDWRYGGTALQALTKLVKRLAADDSQTALIGAPTLVRPLLAQAASYGVHLVDRNPLWKACFSDAEVHTVDVAIDPCPSKLVGHVDVVIVDPPWYLESYASFMWFGRQLIRPSGMLAMSVLPIGTRPTAGADRAVLSRVARQLGLRLIEEHAAVLGYSTPPFEQNALRSAGITAPLDEWRYADLWVFSVSGNSTVVRPNVRNAYPWNEVIFDTVRIQFDPRAGSGSLELKSIVTQDILPSVSARCSDRSRATVWTSGNRVFSCADSAALYRLCRDTPWHADRGFDSVTTDEKENSALTHIARIIDTELAEYGNRK